MTDLRIVVLVQAGNVAHMDYINYTNHSVWGGHQTHKHNNVYLLSMLCPDGAILPYRACS